MRIESAYVGDRIPRSAAYTSHVTDQCIGTRGALTYICCSCCARLANGHNLLEHVGTALGQSHIVALECRDCHGYHPLPASTIDQLKKRAMLWPFHVTDAGTAAADPDPPTR